jgi:hypothetical protein
MHDRTGRIVEEMVHRQYLDPRGQENGVTNVYPSLPTDQAKLTDEAIAAHPDTGVRQISKVVHVQDAAMHHKGLIANKNALGTGVEIDVVIQVDVTAQVYVGRLTQTDMVLNEREAITLKDQPVGQGSHTDADQAWDTPQKEKQGLLQDVTAYISRLTLQIVTQPPSPGGSHRRVGHPRDEAILSNAQRLSPIILAT